VIDATPEIKDPVYSFDNQEIYFSARIDIIHGFDIMVSHLASNKWSSPLPLGSPVNTREDETAPSISPDNRSLYFARRNPDKSFENVCNNLYVAQKNVQNEWDTPVMMSKWIVSGCDDSPHIAADGKTLYFSSFKRNGRSSEWDVFFTKYYSQNLWIKPLGIDTVNTKNSEVQPVYVSREKCLYFLSRNKKGSLICATPARDEFKLFPVVRVNGTVTSKEEGKPLACRIDVYNYENNLLVATTYSESVSGNYTLCLEPGKLYQLDFHAQGWSHHIEKIDARTTTRDSLFGRNIQLFNSVTTKLTIVDDELFSPVDCMFEVFTNGFPEPAVIKRLYAGSYQFRFEVGNKYSIVLHNDDYYTDTLDFDLSNIVQYDDFELDFELKPRKTNFLFTLVDQESGDSLNFPLVITNKNNNEVINVPAATNGKGKYILKLRKNDTYEITTTTQEGYFFMSQTVNMAEYTNNEATKSRVKLRASQKLGLEETASQGYMYLSQEMMDYQTINKNDTTEINTWRRQYHTKAITLRVEDTASYRSTGIPGLKAQLVPVSYNTTVELKNIYFETNSYTLDENSFRELNLLLTFLMQNAGTNILIMAHTDDVGDDAYNYRLSDLRATSVATYLLNEGLPPGRISSKGCGETKPIVANTSDENRAKNRRVEFNIIKE